MLYEALKRFPKSTRLRLLHAYLEKERLDNKFKAVSEMVLTEQQATTIEQQFCMYKLKNLVEKSIIEEDIKNTSKHSINVMEVATFNNNLQLFKESLYKAVQYYISFWRELLEENPDVAQLHDIGSRLTSSLSGIGHQFDELQTMSPQNLRIMTLYGNFLTGIIHDHEEGPKLLEKITGLSKSRILTDVMDNEINKFGTSSNACMIITSGNLYNIGTIKYTNNEINRLLGYSKQEVVGFSINRILPKVLADIHDDLMKRYFNTSQNSALGFERLVFPRDRNGYLVPSLLMVKVLPTLSDGVSVIGFLREVDQDSNRDEFNLNETGKPHFIVFGGQTGIIHGVTYGLRQEFGISSELCWGNNYSSMDFTIDSIFPEINVNNLEALKSKGGAITQIDTSLLPMNYIIHATNGEESNDENDVVGEDDKRFRIGKVRAKIIQDDTYFGVNIQCLKFYEFDRHLEEKRTGESTIEHENSNEIEGNQDPDGMRYMKTLTVPNPELEMDSRFENMKSMKPMVTLRMPDFENGERSLHHEDEISVLNSSMGQSRSVHSEVSHGEEMDITRQLKDIKTTIAEKNLGTTIKLLLRTVIAVFIILLILSSLELSFKFEQIKEFDTGLSSILMSHNRELLIADINLNSRKLELVSRDMIIATDKEKLANSLKTNLEIISELAQTQLNLTSLTATLSSLGVDPVELDTLTLEYLLENDVNANRTTLSEAVFQYITASSYIKETSLAELALVGQSNNARKNFYFIRRNGYGPLREYSELAGQQSYETYVDRLSTYDTKFLILMIVYLGILLLSLFVFVPITFMIYRTNDRAMSLFGYISLKDITGMAERCEAFIEQHLRDIKYEQYGGYDEESEDSDDDSDSEAGHDYRSVPKKSLPTTSGVTRIPGSVSSFKERSNKPSKSFKSMKSNSSRPSRNVLDMPETTNHHVSELDPNVTTGPGLNETMKPFHKGRIASIVFAKKMARKLSEIERQRKLRAARAEAEESFQSDRSQKLLASRSGSRTTIFIQCLMMNILLIGYYIADYLHEMVFLQNLDFSLDFLVLNNDRAAQLNYLVGFTTEELAEVSLENVYKYSDCLGKNIVNSREQYSESIETTQKAIDTALKENHPGAFADFLQHYKTYNGVNLCQLYNQNEEKKKCKAVAEGILEKGLSVAVTSIILNTEDVIQEFGFSGKSLTDQMSALNHPKMNQAVNIMKHITPAMKDLVDGFKELCVGYLHNTMNIDKLKYSIFILLSAFIIWTLWIPYMKRLNNKIFRTKGMLNMIPLDIILKNENLKTTFLSGEIIKAVR